jgi:hypothetical protein
MQNTENTSPITAGDSPEIPPASCRIHSIQCQALFATHADYSLHTTQPTNPLGITFSSTTKMNSCERKSDAAPESVTTVAYQVDYSQLPVVCRTINGLRNHS